ncbi:MFS transporter [Sphingobacterium sp. UT-1RO-CII-1]|uniref:CynX/NimT family MFS transporter n=1 Tax=Sphingobacterium sp. UT-1RO-CII-1 TaxID=2995225 RepID=UPI00227C7C8C|nr:MFS transporter [Sphingobacterium sp. UT-1RO-CII-1]MCY4778963.1 MFS transporter [Sphingobacterium sp. UT-1RO-CII-1]
MDSNLNNNKQKASTDVLFLIAVVAVVFAATNLRSPLTAVGPVVSDIVTYFQLSNVEAGLLTAVPLFMFAALSGFVGALSTKHPIERLMVLSVILLLIGLYLRVAGTLTTLYLGTAMVGLGICVGNVVMPGFVKKQFPEHVGVMTGVYSVAMNLTAALAAGLSVQIGDLLGMGWKGSLGVWIIPALLTLLIWLLLLLNVRRNSETSKKHTVREKNNLYKISLAWNISLFMGLQSVVYYCLVAWLPVVLQSYGMQAEDAGWMLSYMQFAMIPISFVGPIIASRMVDQRPMMVVAGISFITAILLLLFFGMDYAFAACMFFGVANGLSFGMVMLFFSIRTTSSNLAMRLSGMAQSVGYLLAGFGPLLFGALFDVSQDWVYSFIFLLVIAVLLFYNGMRASAPRKI